MRPLRILKQDVWYEISTRFNNREPLFRRHTALVLFARVFRETERRFAFAVRGLCLEGDGLRFYIKPLDGLELPAIMKLMKQTFAQRFNRENGRTGHIWGDRYWSRIVEGDPPAEGALQDTGDSPCGVNTGVRPHGGKTRENIHFPLIFPFPAVFSPG